MAIICVSLRFTISWKRTQCHIWSYACIRSKIGSNNRNKFWIIVIYRRIKWYRLQIILFSDVVLFLVFCIFIHSFVGVLCWLGLLVWREMVRLFPCGHYRLNILSSICLKQRERARKKPQATKYFCTVVHSGPTLRRRKKRKLIA